MKTLCCFITVIMFWSCNKPEEINCENLICTQEFRIVNVKFIDALGNAIEVKDFKSLNLRTNKDLTSSNYVDPINAKGYYTVVTDANTKDLSSKGDYIRVSAKHPVNGTIKEVDFVVSGGECACHISKISGPEEIVFK
ncbi:hypothetical protein [Pedobacter cryophilus]|uniref:Uncharacterized protein n=1 Tax=Pedobacter cryophilus TaxID=2571271 RepID=A0A4U1C5H2_9SPHI|nr:hypothetical protein [Pedobacter cryophilus]TKC00629.1 hypothetical protein FA046_02815 [Pedobacter cryophilus]